MLERVIEKYFKKKIKEKKGETRKVRWLDRRGAPDRLAWIPGWRWPKMPELKRPGKDLEEHQKREHKRLRRMGIECCKLNTFEDVDRFVDD